MDVSSRGDCFAAVERAGVVPVINIPRPELAVPLAQALCAGGLRLLEVTLRNESALESLRRIREAIPDMTLSAGTVLSCEQADAALEAGADFIVTPGFNPKVVSHCLERGARVLPGCVTPTEIEAGREMGLHLFKFFPSEQLGGVKTIRELGGPYRDVRFVPTSGITLSNIPPYLSCPQVAAVGGSCMAPAALVQAQDWAGVTALCQAALRAAHGFHLVHVGINGSAAEGEAYARRFCEIFQLPYHPNDCSDFAGEMVECCKMPFPGEKGHIAVGANSVNRAYAYLKARGVRFREDSITTDASGRMVKVYLEEEIGGFAVHLIKCN